MDYNVLPGTFRSGSVCLAVWLKSSLTSRSYQVNIKHQTFIGIILVYYHQICIWTTIDVSNCVSKCANLLDFKIRKLWSLS